MSSGSLPNVTGVILAGGQSRRMGRDKAFIDLDGEPLISRVIERVKKVSVQVIIVTNDPKAYARFGIRLVGDLYPGKGSLGGIFSGLKSASEEYVLAVACDMPFLKEDLMRYMISLAPKFDVIIPRAQDRSGKTMGGRREDKSVDKRPSPANQPIAKERDLHPLHAIYSKACLIPIEKRLRADDLRLIGFHDAVRVRVVEEKEIDRFDPAHLSFFNVNTPEDLLIASRSMTSL